MANVLRDFFILEFAVYNVGNARKQLDWIRRGIFEVNEEFLRIEKNTEMYRRLASEAEHYRRVISSLRARAAAGEDIDRKLIETVEKRYAKTINSMRLIESELQVLDANQSARLVQNSEFYKRLAQEAERYRRGITWLHERAAAGVDVDQRTIAFLEQQYAKTLNAMRSVEKAMQSLTLQGQRLDHVIRTIAAGIVISFGVLSLHFKALLDNFYRLDREAIALVNNLGMNETAAFALAKALENINLSGGQFANALTSMVKTFFTDYRKQLTAMRFGIDPSMIFRMNPMAFAQYVMRAVERSGYPQPLQRAILVSLLGRELVDMLSIMKRYNFEAIMREYLKVFTPEMIGKLRVLIVQLQIVVAKFWVLFSDLLGSLIDILGKWADRLIAIQSWLKDTTLGRLTTYLGELVAMLLMIGVLFASVGKLVGIIKQVVTVVGGVIGAIRGALGVKAIIGALAALSTVDFTQLTKVILVIIGMLFGLELLFNTIRKMFVRERPQDKVADKIEQNTRATAYYTQLMAYQLNDIRTDLARALRVTMLGGTMPPIYEIINLQMRQAYGMMHNTSAF